MSRSLDNFLPLPNAKKIGQLDPKKSQNGHKIRQKVKVRLQWNFEIILIRIFVPMIEHQYIFTSLQHKKTKMVRN